MRRFPDPDNDAITAFSFHSTRIERIPISRQDIDQTLSGAKINPFLEGQYKAIDLIRELATDPDLIPPTQPANWQSSLDQLYFLKRIHRNLFRTVADYGVLTIDPSILPPHQVGEWRDERKWVANKEMPNPVLVPHLLFDWWSDLISFHNQYREKIEMPQLLDDDDIKVLVNKAYETNLKLCCIKPFTDGSNRVARITENLLRFNWGLPLKIIRHEDEFKLPYIDEIRTMQESYPA
jgi:hypothetical protein